MSSTTPNTPFITIGITCFNAEKTITRAIESARRQDWPRFEIVIVDDASTDSSVQIIRQIKEQEQRISLYCHLENQGVAAARNTIIRHAQGEYIAFFDDDDESFPSRLNKQYERLSQFQPSPADSPVLCYLGRYTIYPETKKLFLAIGHRLLEPSGNIVIDYLLWGKQTKGYELCGDCGTGTLMASQATLKEFGFDPRFRRVEDWDIAIRVASKGGYCISVGEALMNQYVTQSEDKEGRIILDYILAVVKKNKKYLQKRGVYFCAIIFNHARFHLGQKNMLRGLVYLALSVLFFPIKYLPNLPINIQAFLIWFFRKRKPWK